MFPQSYLVPMCHFSEQELASQAPGSPLPAPLVPTGPRTLGVPKVASDGSTRSSWRSSSAK